MHRCRNVVSPNKISPQNSHIVHLSSYTGEEHTYSSCKNVKVWTFIYCVVISVNYWSIITPLTWSTLVKKTQTAVTLISKT